MTNELLSALHIFLSSLTQEELEVFYAAFAEEIENRP